MCPHDQGQRQRTGRVLHCPCLQAQAREAQPRVQPRVVQVSLVLRSQFGRPCTQSDSQALSRPSNAARLPPMPHVQCEVLPEAASIPFCCPARSEQVLVHPGGVGLKLTFLVAAVL